MKRPSPRVLRVLLVLCLVAPVTVARFPAAAEARVIELAIRGGALPAEQRVIRLQQGDDVTLRWTTDAPVTIHLHGYDLERTLKPGAPTAMSFRARATGRFPITVHGAGRGAETTLGYLEVHPP
jgi:FtsP/CotA-like multicopper oxidase with cupredoxin domain